MYFYFASKGTMRIKDGTGIKVCKNRILSIFIKVLRIFFITLLSFCSLCLIFTNLRSQLLENSILERNQHILKKCNLILRLICKHFTLSSIESNLGHNHPVVLWNYSWLCVQESLLTLTVFRKPYILTRYCTRVTICKANP